MLTNDVHDSQFLKKKNRGIISVAVVQESKICRNPNMISVDLML